MKTNAKKELIDFVSRIENVANIKAAIIYKEVLNCWRDEGEDAYERITAILESGYSTDDYINFLEKLDGIDYDSGFGGQELFGIIWFEDGTWATRGEYDGSEWWEYCKCPDIQEHFRIFEGRHGEPEDPAYE